MFANQLRELKSTEKNQHEIFYNINESNKSTVNAMLHWPISLKQTRNVSKKGNYFQYSITTAKPVRAEKVQQFKHRHICRYAVADSMNDTVNYFRNRLISNGNVFQAHCIAVCEGRGVERHRSRGSVYSQL